MSDYSLPSINAAVASRMAQDGQPLWDVRKAPAVQTSGLRIRGADWIDPFTLDFAHPVLGAPDPLVFYCVHGHEVSRFATALARVAGRQAHYVAGGFEAMRNAGAPVEQVATGEQE